MLLPQNARLASKLLVPIVILRSSSSSTEEVSHKQEHVHVRSVHIEEWLRALLPPGQELAVVVHEHYISEHPLIAVALAKARGTFIATDPQDGSPVAVPYIRSAELVKVGGWAVGDCMYVRSARFCLCVSEYLNYECPSIYCLRPRT
jgi:hypothetical protein